LAGRDPQTVRAFALRRRALQRFSGLSVPPPVHLSKKVDVGAQREAD
jgi:hypothetical protein